MSSTHLSFGSREDHRLWLAGQAALPRGFRAGAVPFTFSPREVPSRTAKMTLTLLELSRPTPDFAAVFTKNAFPGAPVKVGRRRMAEPSLSAILINNKISNVCAPGGEVASERLCADLAPLLGVLPGAVLPCSTGIIGWQLPVDAMSVELPRLVTSLTEGSILPAAEGIMTTDLYPKVRRATVGKGSIVGIAKGAGMIEPNLATLLVFVLTDLAVPRETLRAMLPRAMATSFNAISIDSDTSTSDTVALVSSGVVPCDDLDAFEAGLVQVCQDLAEDVVRNGEGVHHVVSVQVAGAPTAELARGIGKSVINAPLFKCAVAGNDPNVGRLVQAVGKYVGSHAPDLDLARTRMTMGRTLLVDRGEFLLNPNKEVELVEYLKSTQMYSSQIGPDGVFTAPLDYPPHERRVEIGIDLGLGSASAAVLGADLTHEYVSENADYRS